MKIRKFSELEAGDVIQVLTHLNDNSLIRSPSYPGAYMLTSVEGTVINLETGALRQYVNPNTQVNHIPNAQFELPKEEVFQCHEES